jgi:hypothetical protein
MAYQINKTDGTILATVADGQVDQLSTDLTLIGKNYSGFGEVLNENFIKLLENFAETIEPENPIKGQIWFDSSELKLKVYNGSAFVPVSSATISNTQPLTLGVGDLWFNDIDKQLFFYDGTNTILLGPSYSAGQGLSGLRVANILDTLNQNRVVTYLYNNGVLLGIFSKDSFTPKIAIEGFDGDIIPGFNAGTLSGMKFDVTVTNSEQLGGEPASSYVRNDTSNIINGQLILTSNLGLIVGDASQLQMFVSSGNVVMANIASNKKMTFNVRRGVVSEEAVDIDSENRTVTFYNGLLDSEVITGGNFTVRGNLVVEGDTTTVQTSVLTIEDKNIVLASLGDSSANNDEYADGGGIVLKGASDHEFTWDRAQTAWYSTEHINLASGKALKINGITVIDGTSLGPSITSIPGVTSFGAQTELTVDDFYINDNVIQITASNTDLVLNINGTGTLNLSNKKISNLADPVVEQDAATKEYVDNTIETRNLVFSMDISDGISNTGIGTYLTQLAPPGEYRDGTLARILCTIISNSAASLDINALVDPNKVPTEVLTPSGTAFVTGSFAFDTASIPAQSVSVTRIVKIYQLVSGAWTFIS